VYAAAVGCGAASVKSGQSSKAYAVKESTIQKDTIRALAANGFLAMPIEYRGRRGCPDLMVFGLQKPGVVVFLELKTKKGKPNQIQLDNLRLYSLWGNAIAIVRSADEAVSYVKQVFYGDEETIRNANENKRTAQGDNVCISHGPDKASYRANKG
jgi:hypothetical protein